MTKDPVERRSDDLIGKDNAKGPTPPIELNETELEKATGGAIVFHYTEQKPDGTTD